jgi:hypothetical protein
MNQDHPSEMDGTKEAEQIQIAREIGAEITEVFVRFVRGRIPFDEMTFGVFDALHNISAVAASDYDVEADDDDQAALEEQEKLAQEPARNGTHGAH